MKTVEFSRDFDAVHHEGAGRRRYPVSTAYKAGMRSAIRPDHADQAIAAGAAVEVPTKPANAVRRTKRRNG